MQRNSLASYNPQETSHETQLIEVVATDNASLSALTGNESYNCGLEDDDLKPVTKSIQKFNRTKRRYINTPNKVRIELIDAVHKHGEKIKQAAKRLGINYSSAKAICQVYKKEGRSDKIVIKKRVLKQESKFSKQEMSQTESDFEEKSETKEKIFLKTSKSKQESIFSEKFLLEYQKACCKEEAYLSQKTLKGVMNPEIFNKSLSEEKHLIHQIVNQNNTFITVHPNYFPQAQKLNTISVKEFLPNNFQSTYNQGSNIMAPFGLQSLQSQHEVLSRVTNSPMTQRNLNFPKAAHYNYERQAMHHYQTQLKQNNLFYLASNIGANPSISLLANNRDNLSTIQQQSYGLFNPTTNLLSFSTMTSTPNGPYLI